MSIEFNCECGRYYKVDETLAGKRAKCKQCGQVMTVPTLDPVEMLDEDLSLPPEEYGIDGMAAQSSAAPPPPYSGGRPIPGVAGEGDTLDSLVVNRQSTASNTARAQVDFVKYFTCHPSWVAIGLGGLIVGIIGGAFAHPAILILAAVCGWMFVHEVLSVRARFRTGDVNPAIVVSNQPWRVAYYVDLSTGNGTRPSLMIHDEPLGRMTGGPAFVGQRLAAVVHYHGDSNEDAWREFNPTLVSLGVTDKATCDRVVASMPARDWRVLDEHLSRLPDYRPGFYRLWLGQTIYYHAGLRKKINDCGAVFVCIGIAVLIGWAVLRKQSGLPIEGHSSQAIRRPSRSPAIVEPSPPPVVVETPTPEPRPGPVWVGMQIELFWGDLWWPAVVAKVDGDRYLVHRDGAEDEWVKADQIRPNPNPKRLVRLPAPGAVAIRTPAPLTNSTPPVPTPPASIMPVPAETPAVTKTPPHTEKPRADANPASVVNASATYSVGQKVDIYWGNQWWPGVIKAVEPDGYKVGYDGWSEGFDETVQSDRLKKK